MLCCAFSVGNHISAVKLEDMAGYKALLCFVALSQWLTDQIIDAATDVQRKTPLELFEELYEVQNNQPMSKEQRTFAQDLIESIWEERI